MRYSERELKQASDIQNALIGSNFYESNFEENITKCLSFKTKGLEKARMKFESTSRSLSPLEKQEALSHLVHAVQDLTGDVSKMNGAKETKLSPQLRGVLEEAKLEVLRTSEHFKNQKPEQHGGVARNIDSEYIAALLADLVKALINMLTLGVFGKNKEQPKPSFERDR